MLFKCHDFNGLNYSDLTNERPILLIPATGAPASGLTVILQPSPGRKPRRKTTDLLYTPWLPLSAGIGKNHFYRIGGQSDAVSLFADDKPQPVGTVRICMPDSQPEVVASATFFRSQCWSEHKLLKRIPRT
jgi:hypothetical protein